MLNKNLDAERLPLEEERLNRFLRYAGMMTELSLKNSVIPGLSALPLPFGSAIDTIGKATISPESLYAFVNLDFDIDDDEVEILEKSFKNYYFGNVPDLSSSQTERFWFLRPTASRGKIETINWPSDEDHRFDKISDIIDDSETFHDYDGNALYFYSLMSALDGVYGKNESRFIAKILRKCKFNEDIKEQLDEFIKELCRYEQKIEEVKNSSTPYKEVVSGIEKILEQKESSVRELYVFIKILCENGDKEDE